MRMVENDLAGLLGQSTASRFDVNGRVAISSDVHLGSEDQSAAFGVIAGADRRTGGLRQMKIDALVCDCLTCLLIEAQTAGGDVDRVLSFPRRSLVRAAWPFSIPLEIDIYFAFGEDVACLRIVFEIIAIDLVEAIRFFSVH